MTLTAKDVAEITRLLEESSFDELTLEVEGLKLTVRRSGAAARTVPEPAEAAGPTGPGGPTTPTGPASTVSPQESSQRAATRAITAPLLGTFYRAPKPGAPPFIDLGSVVQEDTIIGIIEVMKLMNTVRAETHGRIVDILVQDGVLVEYGEVLMRVGEAELA